MASAPSCAITKCNRLHATDCVQVEITQPGDSPLCPLDTFFNPDLADIPGDSDV